ncbi:uncharacterized protein LOC105693657 isoform X4 [Athalia rosae]|uniref:uncharacterized protein LOC105693657 isoform X4 n=1 Tax=Athalia rosae TaxID=37344 RepID=UPI0020342A12|nr:uncharacterized protein LOC105693657 isoform X4 [Athalia rosae]
MLKFCSPGGRRRNASVNPGSKAAQQGVREGDLISSINGKLTRNLTNSESHDLLRGAGEQLTLGLNQEGQIGSPKRRIYKSSLQENTSTETLKKITTKTISSNTRLVQQTSEQKINGSDDTRNDRSYVGQNGGLKTSTDQSNGEVKSAEDYEALDYATDAEDAFSTMPHNARARKNRRNRQRKRFQAATTDKCPASDETSSEVAPPNEINENCNGAHVGEGQDAVLNSENENDESVVAPTRLNGNEEDATSENLDSEKDDVVYESINFSKRKPKNRCRIEKKALDTEIRICEITTIRNLPCEAKVDHIPGVGILETGSTKAVEPFVTVDEPVEPLSKTVASAVALALLKKNNSLDIHEVSDSDVEPDNSKVIVVEVESDVEKEPVGEIVDLDEENTTLTQSEVVEEDATLEKYYEDLRRKREKVKDEEKTVRSDEESLLTAEEQELLKPEPPMSKEVEEKLRCFIEGLKLPASPEEARDDCQKAEDERTKAESKAAKKAKKRAILESYFSQTQAANRFLGIIQEEGEKLSEDDEQHIRDFINEEISKYRREERKLRENADHEELEEFRKSHISVRIEGPDLVFLKESSDSPTTNENEITPREENVYESIEFKNQNPSNSDVVKVTTSVKELPVLEDVQRRNLASNHVNARDSESRHPPDPPKRSSSFNNDVEPQRPPTPPEIDYLNVLPEVPPLPHGVNSTGQKIPPVPPIRRKSVHFAEEDEMILIPERPPPAVREEESFFRESGCIADSIYENVNLTRSTCKHPPDGSSRSDVGRNLHTVRICQSNVKTEENTVDFIKTLLTILTQRNTTYQDVQGFLSGFDLGVLPKNIRDIIDELMEPSSRASSESDSTELRNASDFVSENIGGSRNDATPETAHDRGDENPRELPNSTHTLFEVPDGAVARTESNVSESRPSLDEEFLKEFSSRSERSATSSTTAQEAAVIEAREKRERITTEIDAFTADAARLCPVKNNQSENTLDQRENNSEKHKLEEALCSTNALSPAELIDQDSSSSAASLSTAKYNPESSSLTDINSVIHEDEKTTTDSPQPKRKLKLLNENGDQKTDGKEDQDSPQPIPYSPVEDFYYPTFDESEGFDNLVDAKPDLLKDLCIKKILSLPYGEQIINEITLPKFNIFKNLQTIQESVNLIPEGQTRNSKGPKSNDGSSDPKTADTEGPSSEEMSERRPRTWMGVQTREDPQVFVCLSPSQQTKKSPTISADNLLDLHKKFIERRGYHESEKRDEKILETYRMEVRKEDENLGSLLRSVGVEDDARNDGRSSRWSGDWHIPMPSNRLLEIIKENSVASHVGGSGTSSKIEGIVPRSKDAIHDYYCGSKCTGSSRNANGVNGKNCATITRVPSLEENQERLRATRLSDWLNLARRNSVDDTNNAPKMSGDLLIEESNRRKYETTDKFAATGNTRPVNNEAWGGCRAAHPEISGSVNVSNGATDVEISVEQRAEKISRVATRKISESSANGTKNVEQVHYVNSALIDCSGDHPIAPVSRSATPFSKNPISCNSAIIDKSGTGVEFERRTPIPKKNDAGKHVNVNSALINDRPEVPPKMKRSVNVDRSCIDTTSIFDKEPPRNHLQRRRHQEGDRMKQCTAVEIMENLKQLQSDMKQQMDDRRRFSLPQEYFDKQLSYIEQLEDQLKNVIIAEEEEQKAYEEVVNHVDKLKPRPHSIIGGPSVNFRDLKSTPETSRDAWSSKDRQNDENGYKHRDVWHEESKNITKDRSEYVKKDGCHEESKRVSKENGCRTEESKSSESREERYVISKRGDLIERVQPRLNPFRTDRPKSTISAVATSGEKFREQMYNEYVNKVQEREDRKQHKVIKISSHKDVGRRENEKIGKLRGGSIEKEFIARAKNRLDKFGIKLDESESEVEGQSGDKVKSDEPKYVIDGDQVIDVRTLPKHLQEFLRLASQDDDENNMFAPTFKATATKPGVWSPGSEPPPAPKQPSPDRGKEGDASEKDAGIPPVWTPTSATTSPVVERKEFRPVPFESPVLSRKNKVQAQSSTEEAPPPWEGEEYKKEASQILSQTITTRIVNSHSAPSQGLNTLASPPRLPRAQNPTITLLQKAREGQLPKGAAYLEEVNHGAAQSKNDEKPIISPGEIIYTVKKEYESEPESENIRPKKMADLGPRKFEGIGPITKEGIPLVLRSEVKENNQAKWYKKMYDSLHRAEHDDDYITIRYKPRRGTRYGYGSASGYLSEPEPRGNVEKSATLDSRRRQRNKENDFSTSTIPRKNGSSVKPTTEIYRNQPGRIEDYEPGRSSIADKETKEWWDEVMDIFDGWLDENVSPRERALSEITSRDHRRLSESSRGQPGLSLSYMQGICPKRSSDINVDVKSPFEQHSTHTAKPYMSHALKESGYESDSTLVFRRREDASPLSPLEQRLAYKTVQRGGDVPLHGLRKPAPERPKEYDTAPPPPPKAPHYKGDRQESPRRYVEGEVTIHYRSPVRTEAKEVLTEAELARRSAENMRRVYQEERRRKYLQELHDIDSRRHTDNFTPSQKSPIPLNRYDDFVDDLSHRSRSQEQTPEPRLVAKALYNFVGQSSRELTFRRGDIIFVRRQVDKNWYEGEHNAMIGLFPFNYVEILPYDGIRTTTPKKPYEGQARAKFNFVAQTTHELSLVKGDLVVLTRRVDQNWYEGRIGNRKGIFPISYVEVLVEPGVIRSETPAQNKPVAAPAAHSLLSNGSAGGKLSMGPHHYTPSIPTNTNAAQAHYNSLPRMGGTKLHVAPVNETLHIDTHSEPLRYRALYNYRPQNDDELELREGDSVYVMEKCDDGWFVGSSQRTGCFGTFPGNYVERL